MMNYRSICAVLALTLVVAGSAVSQKLKPEEILAKHLESIAPADVRAGAKTLIAVGNGTSKFTSQKDITLQGRLVLASDNAKSFLGMNMNSSEYRGETFAFNGKDLFIGFASNGARSVFGNFIQSNGAIVTEGLMGGVLSTGWALTRLEANKAKLSGVGTKKINGQELYAVDYSKKGGGDIDIVLFFDKETFRHVRTEYKRMSSAGIGSRPEQSTGFSETRFLLVEEFGDFKAQSGMMLPHSYRVFYSVTGGQGTTGIEWKFDLTEFAVNQKLDSTTFETPAK